MCTDDGIALRHKEGWVPVPVTLVNLDDTVLSKRYRYRKSRIVWFRVCEISINGWVQRDDDRSVVFRDWGEEGEEDITAWESPGFPWGGWKDLGEDRGGGGKHREWTKCHWTAHCTMIKSLVLWIWSQLKINSEILCLSISLVNINTPLKTQC